MGSDSSASENCGADKPEEGDRSAQVEVVAQMDSEGPHSRVRTPEMLRRAVYFGHSVSRG